jgi:hypothetical protein
VLKPVYMPVDLILNKKKGVCLQFLKKISLKLLERILYVPVFSRIHCLLIMYVMNTAKFRKYLVASHCFRHTKLNLQVLKTEQLLNVHGDLFVC